MKTFIMPYKMHSKGAKALARELRCKRTKRDSPTFKGRIKRVLINWGSSDMGEQHAKCDVLNDPAAVKVAGNKLRTYEAFSRMGIEQPEYTTDRDEAYRWQAKGITFLARTLLSSSSGKGIVIVNKAGDFPLAKVYVKYKPKKYEFRHHVMNDEVFLTTRKVMGNTRPDEINWKVRSAKNGFIYQREGLNKLDVDPALANDLAIQAVNALGLDFGAVDVIYNEKENKFYVLEVNTAPGLHGSTVGEYASKFKENYGVSYTPTQRAE